MPRSTTTIVEKGAPRWLLLFLSKTDFTLLAKNIFAQLRTNYDEEEGGGGRHYWEKQVSYRKTLKSSNLVSFKSRERDIEPWSHFVPQPPTPWTSFTSPYFNRCYWNKLFREMKNDCYFPFRRFVSSLGFTFFKLNVVRVRCFQQSLYLLLVYMVGWLVGGKSDSKLC